MVPATAALVIVGTSRGTRAGSGRDHRRLRRLKRHLHRGCGSTELQNFANETGLASPAGQTSALHATSDELRARPLVRRRPAVRTAPPPPTGLEVYAQLDEGTYWRATRSSDAKLPAVNLTRHEFHGAWNYAIKPQSCLIYASLGRNAPASRVDDEAIEVADMAQVAVPVLGWHHDLAPSGRQVEHMLREGQPTEPLPQC